MSDNEVDLAIVAVLGERTELTGPLLRKRAGLSNDQFYAAILELETSRKVKSRWAEGSEPKVRFYRLADVQVASES